MKLEGAVAVITGAASGIGLGLAERAAQRGMSLVLADVEETALQTVAHRLRDTGARTLALRCDVSRLADVEALAAEAYDAFGCVSLLCNNAGVNLTVSRPVWEYSPGDWKWMIDVNLWGIIHGMRAFLQRMLDQEAPSHILNTASSAALLAGPGLGLYKLTKHAVLSLSETTYHDLQAAKAPVGVSVFCPGLVKTSIRDAARNRPASLRDERARTREQEAAEQKLRAAPGLSRAEAGEIALRGVESGLLYVFTEAAALEAARTRLCEMEACAGI
jgi:NAD(P)-dependent dehydrogenase (short-subunit alcohol dehydrogenase family)